MVVHRRAARDHPGGAHARHRQAAPRADQRSAARGVAGSAGRAPRRGAGRLRRARGARQPPAEDPAGEITRPWPVDGYGTSLDLAVTEGFASMTPGLGYGPRPAPGSGPGAPAPMTGLARRSAVSGGTEAGNAAGRRPRTYHGRAAGIPSGRTPRSRHQDQPSTIRMKNGSARARR
jgi:hypothetical protein